MQASFFQSINSEHAMYTIEVSIGTRITQYVWYWYGSGLDFQKSGLPFYDSWDDLGSCLEF